MRTVQQVTGQGSGSLNTIVRHLWMPLLDSGLGRVVVGHHTEPGWHRLHTFGLQPLRRRPRLLVSHGPRRALARALDSYRHLREPASQAGRLLIAGKVASGVGQGGGVMAVETKQPIDAAELEPISCLERIVGHRLLAVVGIRESANGKATLQLFDHDGHPSCYAKVAWSAHTAGYVRTEANALGTVSFARGHTRAPRLVTEGMIGADHPYLMTEPLPSSVRRVAGDDDLSAVDVARMFHTDRHACLPDTGQFQAVLGRLAEARRTREDAELGSLSSRLADVLSRSALPVPVMERWHGDLVPWNAAVDGDGGLWLWDWESSEEDAIGGLDVLHWLVNCTRPAKGASFAVRLQAASQMAADPMRVLGMDADRRAIATAGYALTFAERNWSLAATNGDWSRHRIGREATAELLRFGLAQVGV